jgi:hypothetical protein
MPMNEPVRPLLLSRGLLVASAISLALAAAPLSLDETMTPVFKVANAKNDGGNGGGNGGGGGNGNGGGNGGNGNGGGQGGGQGGGDRADRGHGHGYGHDKDKGNRGERGSAGYASLDQFVDEMRSNRGKKEFAAARDRFDEAVSKGHRGRGYRATDAFGPKEKAASFSPEETKALIERGWKGKKTAHDGFKNHGQRVSTMVELVKQLGYGARVGALQANFGTPFENGIADLEAELDAARAELESDPENRELQERVSDLEAELAAKVDAAKPGKGPDDSWATADLDYNDDGTVDASDLDDLNRDRSAATDGDTAGAGTSAATAG